MVVEPPDAAGTEAADDDEPLDEPQPASATASRPAAAMPGSHPERSRGEIFMSGGTDVALGRFAPPPRPTHVYRFRNGGKDDTVAFKQLILREVSRQEGDPHWVNIRSTRSRQVRSLEASAGGETEGRNGSAVQRRHS